MGGLLVGVLGSTVSAQPTTFRSVLSGGDEVPARDTGARGVAIFRLNAEGTELGVTRQDHRLRGRRTVGAIQDELVVPRPPVAGCLAPVERPVDAVDGEGDRSGVRGAHHDLVSWRDPEGIGHEVGNQDAVPGAPLDDLDVGEHLLAGEQARVAALRPSEDRDRDDFPEGRLDRVGQVGARSDQALEQPIDPRLDVAVPARSRQRHRTVAVHHPDGHRV
jgi:hypothetical protein